MVTGVSTFCHIGDDGIVERLAVDRFHVTGTTGGGARVLGMMEDRLRTEWPDLDDPEKPAVGPGVRLGTSAWTTRGFDEPEFQRVGELILLVVNALASIGQNGDPAVEAAVLEEVHSLCRRFPIHR